MPLLFIVLGIVFILTGIKGDATALWELVQGDFSGPNNFVYWAMAVGVLGALGYVESLQKLSRLFIILVIIVLLLDNKGFFVHFQEFINSHSQVKGQQ